MLEDIRRLAVRLSGNYGRECYPVLIAAVSVVVEHGLKPMKMSEIMHQTARCMGKSEEAVSGALSRAVRDIWEFGNRKALQEIFEDSLWQKPAPKAVIMAMAQYIVNESPERAS